MATIRAHKLTTFSVAPDGGTVSIGVDDDRGEPGALILPTACLRLLVMTLPEMAQQALQRKFADPKLRLVFPVENWALETSNEEGRLILTFSTADGFSASFALFPDELLRMVSTALEGEVDTAPPRPDGLAH